jgi:redox-sensing transcriptional repressor
MTSVQDMEQDKRHVNVGAGNLGRSLVMHGNLGRYGFRVEAIVDSDRSVIGTLAGHLIVQNVDHLVDVVREEKIDIGVIAVPSASAQRVADRLILSGVRGILNLAFTRVIAPKRVQIVDGRIVQSLLLLSCSMAHTAVKPGTTSSK